MMNYTEGEGGWEQRGTLIVAFGKAGAVICQMAEPYPKSEMADYEPLELGSKGWDLQMANASLIIAAPDMYKALQRIMMLDISGALDSMAYSGGDVPKKWLREEAPALDARANARKEIQAIIRPILAKVEAKQ